MNNDTVYRSPMHELDYLIFKCLNYPDHMKNMIIEATRHSITRNVLTGGWYVTPVNYDKLEEFFKAVKEFDFENKTMTDNDVKEHFRVLAIQCIG